LTIDWDNKVTDHPDQAEKFMKEITTNVDAWQKRALAGLAVLKKQSVTDSSRIVAIGYCFGGATVQQLAYSGADIRGIVSFHGTPIPPHKISGEGHKGKNPYLPWCCGSFYKARIPADLSCRHECIGLKLGNNPLR
jgi:dienelactone hydrolase